MGLIAILIREKSTEIRKPSFSVIMRMIIKGKIDKSERRTGGAGQWR